MMIACMLTHIQLPQIGQPSTLILAVVTLLHGAKSGAWVLLAVLFPFAIDYVSLINHGHSMTEFLFISRNLLFINNGLVWMFAILLRRYAQWNLLFNIGLFIGISFVVLLHTWNPNIVDWWGTSIPALYTAEEIKAGRVDDLLSVKYYLAGIFAAITLFKIYLKLALTRWWQFRVLHAGSLGKELQRIRINTSIGILFLIGLAIYCLHHNAIILDIAPLVVSVLALSGFLFLHHMLARAKKGWIGLLLIYAMTVWFFPESLILIAIPGLLDVFFRFSDRANRKKGLSTAADHVAMNEA